MLKIPITMLAVAALALPLLTSCDARTEVSSVAEQFTITKVKPPKRLHVDVVDKRGQSYHVFVSKRCSNWRQIVVGSKVNLERTIYRLSSGNIETVVRARSSSDVCPRG